jgi:Raf kinase inhibitor-like YbhB/YbcL family protein
MKKIIVVIIIVLIGIFFLKIFFINQPHIEKSENNTTIKGVMKITSNAFGNNSPIPSTYSCNGSNINPPLSFSDIPQGTKTLALIMDDPDAPVGTFVHWVIFNIPITITMVTEHMTIVNAIEGINGIGRKGYTGPCPPSGTHRYFFKLYALDTSINLDEKADKYALEQAMQGHIINKAVLIGLFSKK